MIAVVISRETEFVRLSFAFRVATGPARKVLNDEMAELAVELADERAAYLDALRREQRDGR